jgi:hypothetical protein
MVLFSLKILVNQIEDYNKKEKIVHDFVGFDLSISFFLRGKNSNPTRSYYVKFFYPLDEVKASQMNKLQAGQY